MDYVIVNYKAPADQPWPKFGVMRKTAIDSFKFTKTFKQAGGIDLYVKREDDA